MNVANEIYRTRTVYDKEGNSYPLQAHITPPEGRLITDIVEKYGVSKTLEVGCAYGLSSLHICGAIAGRPNPRHVIVDPFQNGKWRGIGIENLRRAGYGFFELVEEGSEFALPRIAKEEPAAFDMVFIDGCHRFDHVLLDLFYADLLVPVRGLIILDDSNDTAVGKAVSYFTRARDYLMVAQSERTMKGRLAGRVTGMRALAAAVPHFFYDRLVTKHRFGSMVALEKRSDERRPWKSAVRF